ncbi:acyltransferase [Escherichia marmotae]|uniref:acyltransferase family protein n=1 Tax=Escherichia marmotae TaxID=1499973 RepID=UPI002FE1DB0F
MSTTKKIDALDFMRAISVILIILFHSMNAALRNGGSWEKHWITAPMGSIGVSFFIIISGAGIYLSSRSWNGALSFYKKRAKNIYPTFWFVYAFASCFLLIFTGRVYIGAEPIKWIITILGFDGYMSWYMPTYYIIGEWFLGFIILMYLIFPLIRPVLHKNKLLALILSIALSIFVYFNNKELSSAIPIFNASAQWNPLVRLPEFIFGAIIASMIVTESRWLFYLFPVAVLYLIIALITFDNLNKGYYSIPALCSLFLIMVCILTKIKFSNDIMSIVKFFSATSFIAFLIHHKIIDVVKMNVNININNIPALYLYMVTILFSVFIIASLLSIPIKYINNVFGKNQ